MHDFADLLSSRRRALLKPMSLVPALGGAPSLRAAGATEGKRGAAAFDLGAVRLLPGPFETARALDARYMLSLDADRLLHNFRVNAGLPPKAPVYGGWESEEPWVSIRCHGHTLGHYLSACAMMAAATGEPEFRRRVDYIVGELLACQEASGGGMVSAFPDGDAQLRNGLAGRSVTGVPWYTQHQVMAGLRDARLHLDHAPALAVLRRMADWIDDAARGCDDATFQRMLQVEHGGMNELLADLFVLTDDQRYLALAQRFNHRALVEPLAEGRDTLDGLHSNTQIPKVVEMNVIVDGGESRTPVPAEPLDANAVTLRTEMDFTRARGRVAYRSGGTWRHLGDKCELAYDWRTGTFQGPQYAIFCFNPGPRDAPHRGQPGGHVDVEWFHFSDRRDEPPTNPEPGPP